MEAKLLKRTYTPITDWQAFLVDAKEEFHRLRLLTYDCELGRKDFEFIKTIGKGSYGRVFLCRKMKTKHYYAIKLIEKAKIVHTKQVGHVRNEKRILQALNFPFCVHLDSFFFDNSYLYLVMPFILGGDMFQYLRKMKRFEEDMVRFYCAQVALALEYIHFCNMMYRDLKPENILIDDTGYIKLTDFGFGKVLETNRTYTQCGTPEYQSPEVIMSMNRAGYSQSSDWWSFGVLLYEMSTGRVPFEGDDIFATYARVVSGLYHIPDYISPGLRDLIAHMLNKDLTQRYGHLRNGVNDIKQHAWFQSVNFLDIVNKVVKPPYIPVVKGPADASNFSTYKETMHKIARENLYSKEFVDF